MKNREKYTIKTPLGIFTDINDAITQYPKLTEHQKINQCPICNKYFIKYGKEDNARKYCSTECSNTYNRINKREINRMWMRDKYIRDKNNTILNDKEHRSENWEFRQDDTFWGLGESNLHEHRNSDEEHEHNIIQKELKRLHLKQ